MSGPGKLSPTDKQLLVADLRAGKLASEARIRALRAAQAREKRSTHADYDRLIREEERENDRRDRLVALLELSIPPRT